MNVELSGRNKNTDREERRERRERIKESTQQGAGEVYDRGNSGVPGERKIMARFRCGNE
jgi:hypothetical protein